MRMKHINIERIERKEFDFMKTKREDVRNVAIIATLTMGKPHLWTSF